MKRLVYTSTPTVAYNGRDLAGADESLPLFAYREERKSYLAILLEACTGREVENA